MKNFPTVLTTKFVDSLAFYNIKMAVPPSISALITAKAFFSFRFAICKISHPQFSQQVISPDSVTGDLVDAFAPIFLRQQKDFTVFSDISSVLAILPYPYPALRSCMMFAF